MIRPDDKKLLAMITRHEGRRLDAYLDSVGVLTVGVGHNLEAHPFHGCTQVGDKISEDTCDYLLACDLRASVQEVAKRFPWAENLCLARQAVLVDMAFNMGIGGLSRFHHFLGALQVGEWEVAAKEMFNSKWAFQVGDGPGGVDDRVDELSRMVLTGEWDG